MKYIYDIILNFNERLYEFYEWKDNDDVEYIKRIPIFKVSNDVFSDLKSNRVLVNNEFINSIYSKCEVYGNYGIGKIDYACLFCIFQHNRCCDVSFTGFRSLRYGKGFGNFRSVARFYPLCKQLPFRKNCRKVCKKGRQKKCKVRRTAACL